MLKFRLFARHPLFLILIWGLLRRHTVKCFLSHRSFRSEITCCGSISFVRARALPCLSPPWSRTARQIDGELRHACFWWLSVSSVCPQLPVSLSLVFTHEPIVLGLLTRAGAASPSLRSWPGLASQKHKSQSIFVAPMSPSWARTHPISASGLHWVRRGIWHKADCEFSNKGLAW